MEKLKTLLESMEEIIPSLYQKRMILMKKRYKDLQASIHTEWESIVNQLQKDKGNSGYLLISYLQCSTIIESYEYKIAWYERKPFVEESPNVCYFSIKPCLIGIEDDIRTLWNYASEHAIQIFDWRKEEIRKYYMQYIYENSQEFFQMIMQDVQDMQKGHHNHSEEKQSTLVRFGAEMGKSEVIGSIEI